MLAFPNILRSVRRPRRAAVAVALGAAAVALPLAGAASAHAATGGDVAPLASIHVNEAYHVPGPWAAGYHTGVDFGADVGTPVHAVGTGTVIHSGWDGAYGIDVIEKLSDGHYALYAHLSKTAVSDGQQLTADQQIGLSGATGNVTGPHLHFEIRTTPNYGSDVDPIAYLRTHGASL